MVLCQDIAGELKSTNQTLVIAKLSSFNSAMLPYCLKAALRHTRHHTVPEVGTGAQDSAAYGDHLQIEQVD